MAMVEPSKILVPAGFLLALLLPVSEALSQVEEEKTPSQRLSAAREYVRSKQNEDGSWFDEIGPNYATAMAILILDTEKKSLLLYKGK